MTSRNESPAEVGLPRTRTSLATITVLVALFALAVWLRFQCIILNGGLERSYETWANANYFGGIARAYIALAAAMLESPASLSPVYPPGYPAFLALLQRLGAHLQQIRYVQATLDACMVPVTYAVARGAGADRHFGLLAAAFVAIFPSFVFGAGFLMAESLSPLLIITTVWLALGVAHAQSTARLAALGVWIGFAALIRPDLVLLVGFVGAWLWLFARIPWRAVLLGAFIGGFCLVVVPWGAYNRVVNHGWVFTSTSGAAGLWEGLGEVSNPYGYVLSDAFTNQSLAAKGLAPHSVEAEDYLRHEYWLAWRQHPAFVLEVIGNRWRQILGGSDQFRGWLPAVQAAFDRCGVYVWVLAVAATLRRPSPFLVLVLPVANALFSIGLVHYEARYVRYVDWSYGMAMVCLASWIATVARPRIAWAGGFIVAALFIALAIPVAQAIPGLLGDVGEARFRNMVETPTFLATLPRLDGHGWQLEPQPGATAEPTVAGMRFSASPGTFEYTARQTFDVRSAEFIVLSYELTLEHGGVTIGMLDASNAWLDSINFAQPGRYAGHLARRWRGGDVVTVVIARNNPRTDETVIELHALSVQTRPSSARKKRFD